MKSKLDDAEEECNNLKNASREAQTLHANVLITSTIAQRDGSADLREKTVAAMTYVTKRVGVSENDLWSETRKRVATVMGAEQQPVDSAKKPREPSKKKVLRATSPVPSRKKLKVPS